MDVFTAQMIQQNFSHLVHSSAFWHQCFHSVLQ